MAILRGAHRAGTARMTLEVYTHVLGDRDREAARLAMRAQTHPARQRYEEEHHLMRYYFGSASDEEWAMVNPEGLREAVGE